MSVEHPAVAGSTEPMIVTSRANPGVSDTVIDELLNDGIGPLDYGTDESLDSEEIDASNRSGRGAINNLVDLSSRGGYGVLHKKKLDRVLLGHILVPAVRFVPIEQTNQDDITLKCFQFDRFAEITGMEDTFPEVFELLDFPRNQHVLGEVQDDRAREVILNAFVQCELEGMLAQPEL
ncbi:hypothetical protein [Halorarum halobium]|uniref:hypothetical protein n=1 Tax=Halorarum halobium TaxID=3075121 RepID=UPI0028A704A1|nr:hypothetical protein [Halobaculum sp. XH14]